MSLAEHIKAAIRDLNEDRSRPVRSGCTAGEVYQRDRIELQDRVRFKKEVEQTKLIVFARAASREEQDCVGHRAVETVLLSGYLEYLGDDVNRFPGGRPEETVGRCTGRQR